MGPPRFMIRPAIILGLSVSCPVSCSRTLSQYSFRRNPIFDKANAIVGSELLIIMFHT